MRIKATEKFSKLGSSNNWAGFGKDLFRKIEAGATVEFDCPDHLLKDGYVEESKSKKKASK
jgi:hypothetical protein